VYVPAGVEPVVLTFMVEDVPGGLTGLGVKPAVAPAGSPVADKVSGWENPYK